MARLTGDRRFYGRVLSVAVPIMIQSGITNFVSLLDNVMVGQVGSDPMSGVSIVNGLIFVFHLCIFGGCSGAGIFTAQYHGSGDRDGDSGTVCYLSGHGAAEMPCGWMHDSPWSVDSEFDRGADRIVRMRIRNRGIRCY